MRTGIAKNMLAYPVGFLLPMLILIPNCWIPLPEETAIVVEVLDAQGGPVDDVEILLDGTETLVTGSQQNEGQVYKSLSTAGDHTVQLDPDTLIDPQGGIGWIALASQLSGEPLPLSFGSRPYAGGSNDVITVPVNKNEITVVTLYLTDALSSPTDNQWLTDGSNPSPYRPENNVDEFRDNPEPVFWWRQDPSLGITVNHTFQMWEDDDGDTRFPLGIIDHAQYSTAMNPSNAGYIQPDWQVPLAGIQRVEAASTVNQIVAWSSQVNESPVKYDLYYAPSTQWDASNWENNPVQRDIAPDGSLDGSALRFHVGNGTPNSNGILKNNIQHTFTIRARDASSNLDTAGSGTVKGQRTATPPSGGTLGSVNGLSVVNTSAGGTLDLSFNCAVGDSLRIYSASSTTFGSRPMDIRFIRDQISCISSITLYSLDFLVNGLSYSVGVEPFDAFGNVGTASSVITAVPAGNISDTDDPSFLGTPLEVDTTGLSPGQVRLTVASAADSTSTVIRRVSWSPASFTNDPEAMLFTDYSDSPVITLVLSDIPSQVPYNYAVRAIDAYGNVSAVFSSQVTLTETDTTGPTWASDDPGFFATISYSTASTVWPLGATWSYNGFSMGRDPAQGQGEYVWRVIQENPDSSVSRASKLGAFYSYQGYYYASTEGSGLSMSSPSGNAAHHDIFSFVEEGISSADVMSTPFDSTDSTGYRQRTAAQYSSSLAAGSSTTNQLAIVYNADEDGQAVVFPAEGGGHLCIMRVITTNKQRPVPTPEPHLQGKEFLLSYYTVDDEIVAYPVPLLGEGIYYLGDLDEADYQDPLW